MKMMVAFSVACILCSLSGAQTNVVDPHWNRSVRVRQLQPEAHAYEMAKTEAERLSLVIKMINDEVISYFDPVEDMECLFGRHIEWVLVGKNGAKTGIVYFREQPPHDTGPNYPSYSGVGWYLSFSVDFQGLVSGYCLSNTHKPLAVLEMDDRGTNWVSGTN